VGRGEISALFSMSEFFEYDPLTGVRTDFEYDEQTGNVHLHRTANVEHLLDHTRALANDGLTDRGIKKGWWLYAKIPPIVMIQLRNKGINVEDGRHIDRVVAEINSNYPALKCTQKNEGKKLTIIHDNGK
jgi:hypothetical protein